MTSDPLSDEFDLFERSGTRVLAHRLFAELSGARHGFSVRPGGGGAEEARRVPLDAAARAAGFGETSLVAALHQVHGDRVVLRDSRATPLPAGMPSGEPRARGPAGARRAPGDTADRTGTVHPSDTPQADAQLTEDPSVVLAIQTADCVPVLVADPLLGALGAAHAGWKGTALGVAGRLVRCMKAAGSRGEDLVALLGPAIGPCCYEVGAEVIAAFRERFPSDDGYLLPGGRPGHAQLDLVSANAATLRDEGLTRVNILRSGLCTACRRDLFPSYRRDGSGAGRMWSLIGRI